MALVLCQSLGTVCDGLAKILTLPCRLCAQTCGLCTDACRLSCDGLCRTMTSPFFPYLALTVGLNLPPSIWAVQSLFGCQATWLYVNGIGTAIHILAAFYIVYQIQAEQARDEQQDVEKGGAVSKETTTSVTSYERVVEKVETKNGTATFASFSFQSSSGGTYKRLAQVLLYDVGVALYIVVFVVWMIWQSIGLSQLLGGGVLVEGCEKRSQHALTLGFCYMMFVCCSFCCSALCLRPL